MSPRVSVVIPTKNAGELLRGALESVAWADEIIVVDMFSTDDTAEICTRFPQCRLLQRDDYIFANVNHGFDQATGDWLLRLDTDERIPPALAEEIRDLVAHAPGEVVGWEFEERVVVLGHELRYGFGTAHFRKMLFRKGAARYPVRTEHEELEGPGTWLRARNHYLHYNYATVGQYLLKTDYYTGKDVERLVLTARPRARDGVVEPLRSFYLNYLKRRGYRDGWVGFVDCGMRAVYQFVMWAKLRERWERERAAR